MEDRDWYVADSYKELETVGGIYERDGKEYINVILKSGKTHAARVYRTDKRQSAKPNHVVYSPYKALGFYPTGYIQLVRCDDEAELKDYCHFHPAFGAYIAGNEPIEELPWEKGLHIKLTKIYWYEIVDKKDHLFSKEKIYDIIKQKEEEENER